MASIRDLSLDDVAIIKARLAKGEFQHRIAADYDLNQGRICEIAKGQRWPNVKPYEGQYDA
ncbi:hypothetical protein [Terasakiella pusilla]|uniref:hypothetical protein n=1 Tax=Terasakiella pusilla TaxID=64973 RepID=UPI003AA9D997